MGDNESVFCLKSCWHVLFAVAFGVFSPLSSGAPPSATSHPLVSYAGEMADYETAIAQDPIAQLQRRLEQGSVELKFDEQFGYLKSILQQLGLPESSQLMVFSKTSLQRYHISSKSPRAIFYNDRSYVAWIPAAPMLELLGVDPKLGSVLYTLPQTKTARPKVTRDNRCLECHVTSRTLDIPGALVRSFHTSKEGEVDLLSGAAVVSHSTPLTERWGGWYVTGDHGRLVHRGNHFDVVVLGPYTKTNASEDVVDLKQCLDVSQYLQPTSDVVSLLVLEHQVHMENLLTRLSYESRAALRQWGHVRYLTNLCETVIRHLLFFDEAPLGGVGDGGSAFAKWFQEQAPRDKQNRTLREFDLRTRLFRYPCSYLIYSDTFQNLPLETRRHLYRRLYKILTGEDTSLVCQKLTPESRRAILEILRDTKQDLPAYWTL